MLCHAAAGRSFINTAALQATELLEWVCAAGDSDTVALVQPFKLMYAEALADQGRTSAAMQYVKAILTTVQKTEGDLG